MKKITLLFTGLFAVQSFLPAQDFCSLVHIPLADRFASADVVVSAKLLRQECFRDIRDGRIYTRNFLLPDACWKGFSALPAFIEMISEGGVIDGEGMSYTNTLMPVRGTEGIWFLHRDASKGTLFPYASLQGLLRKQDKDYYDYDGTLLGKANDILALPAVLVEKNELPIPVMEGQTLRAGSISFSPKTAIAGIGQVLTITGTGFGSTRGNGYVAFNPYGMGFSDPILSATFRYISWSDTKIEVEIPSGFSTAIRVVGSSGVQESTDTLHILANVSMRQFDPADYFYLNNQNGAGGYYWTMHHEIRNNAEAKQATEEVFRHFRCRTGVHYTLQNTGTSARFNLGDNVQTIAFDTLGVELSPGIVARYEQLWSSCILGSETFYYVRSQELRFSKKFSYYYGTGATPAGKTKFRYVMMHELGHSLQLGHVNEEGQTMHPIVDNLPAIKWNQRDTLTKEEIQAGSWLVQQSRNFSFRACGLLPMLQPANCSDVYGSASSLAEFPSESIEIYPNPASDLLSLRGLPAGVSQYFLFSSEGKELRRGSVDANARILLHGLPSGCYFLSLEKDGNISRHKVLKQ
jgi:hypothetical protein